MTATACCTSNPVIYPIQTVSNKSQFSAILPRTSHSPSSSSILTISEIAKAIQSKSDINNNNDSEDIVEESSHITSDDVTIDEEEFLSFVGLRRKTKRSCVSLPKLRPLPKRLTAPLCLLPLAKNGERVRQSLYILLPFLKFLSITNDIELFCSTDDKAKAQSLLPRSLAQSRTTKTINKAKGKRKVSKAEFVTMAATTFRNNTRRTPMAKYIHSTIQCSVILDRLEQSTIDQIMQNSTDDTISSPQVTLSSQSPSKSSSSDTQRSLSQTTTKTTTTRTTITTMTTERTTVKHKLTTTSYNDCKRFKRTLENNNSIILPDKDKTSASTYERIYLKCFVCSKREYIDAQATNSDKLHSHWLEHGNELSLNIYDSDIDGILTRVVEFFHFPKRHTFEGKIQTVFILNSKEVRKTSLDPVDDNACIVLD
ncbi:unnamed protein product [Adineta ricciae]|uniref:Uncharacterized protein n=1 Tax=Adineta ricciae TaxID=249248 RepID=A0A814LIF3_ADIRI|nr:unnamed protein product [Adineta ricciae]